MLDTSTKTWCTIHCHTCIITFELSDITFELSAITMELSDIILELIIDITLKLSDVFWNYVISPWKSKWWYQFGIKWYNILAIKSAHMEIFANLNHAKIFPMQKLYHDTGIKAY